MVLLVSSEMLNWKLLAASNGNTILDLASEAVLSQNMNSLQSDEKAQKGLCPNQKRVFPAPACLIPEQVDEKLSQTA
jgi:hypothetical protein